MLITFEQHSSKLLPTVLDYQVKCYERAYIDIGTPILPPRR